MRAVRVVLAALAVLLGLLAVAPTASAWPVGVEPTAAIDTTEVALGGSLTVTVAHTTPGPLTLVFEPDGLTIGTGEVDANGDGTVTGVVPADAFRGGHIVRATGIGGEEFLWDVQVVSPFAYPDVAYTSSCAGPDRVVVTATFSNATAGETYEVEVSNIAGVTASASQTATQVAFALTVVIDTPPGRLSIVTTDGSRNGFGSLAVDCARPATTDPTPSATSTATDRDAETAGGPRLADTGARTGLGLYLGFTLLVVGAVLTTFGRRRAGTHRA